MYLEPASAGDALVDICLFVGLGTFGVFALAGAVRIILAWWPSLDVRVVTAVGLPVQAGLFTALVFGLLRSRGQPAASVGLRRGRLRFDLPLGLLAAGSGYYAFILSVYLLYLFWPAAFENAAGNVESLKQMLPPLHPLVMVAFNVVIGFYEELVFRGFLLTRMRRALGTWWLAVPLSSACFAALHLFGQRPAMTVPIFFLGISFCLFTIWRKSLLPAMIGHALFNLSQMLWMYYNTDWT